MIGSMLLAAEDSGHAAGEASGWFLENAWLIPLIPFIAFFVIILFGKRLPRGGSEVGLASMGASFVLSIGLAWQWISEMAAHKKAAGNYELEPVIREIVWWQSGGQEFTLGQHIDGLAVTMLILVAFISLLVQLYSTEYVAGDRRYTHFFGSITLFSAGMLIMVLAPNMVQLILGWEIMGLCSFLLIAHWWEELPNAKAGLKAFLTVRVGDMGLLVGTAMLLGIFGTLSINDINAEAAAGNFESKNMLMWAAVALFIACIGKSGQFPLHTWLPDAMAGPTPVSSLLHSSTMVVAGVFLVARLYPVFHIGLDINVAGQQFNLIAVIGAITLTVAAFLAFVQDDIKKVLAYSTVSQLGYMMLGLGVGAWTGAVFHIFTHAFFKCCLFLVAGSISHTASHHSFDMKKDMGGIWKKMPISFGAWMVSTAALCGVPLFAGFFSKDEIIDSAKHFEYTTLWIVSVIGAGMTAAYMTRATYLTWFGKPRGGAAHFMGVDDHGDAHGDHGHDDHGHDDHGHDDHGHDDHHDDDHAAHGKPFPFAPFDSPWRITAPIMILAVLAVGAGYLNAPIFGIYWFEHHTESSIGLPIDHGDDHGGDEGHSEDEGDHSEDDGDHSEDEGDHSEDDADHSDEGAAGAVLSGFGGGGSAVVSGGAFVAAGDYEAPGPFKIPAPPKPTWAIVLQFAVTPVVLAIGIALGLSTAVFGGRKNPFSWFVGWTKRNRFVGAVHRFLVNKLYLDFLYENVIVRAVAYPISKAAYWVNQNVIDGAVDAVGKSGKASGEFVYKYIDQGLVDGAVNASGTAASEGGHALQPMQSGKVNQYGALLFGAAAIGAILLIILNG